MRMTDVCLFSSQFSEGGGKIQSGAVIAGPDPQVREETVGPAALCLFVVIKVWVVEGGAYA